MSILRVLGIDGPEDAQFLRRGDAIENVREQPERNHDAIEREEGLEEDVADDIDSGVETLYESVDVVALYRAWFASHQSSVQSLASRLGELNAAVAELSL